ncbi:AzlC family ABC transporter permease [Sinanaerobacter chloroacetimidivorans]|uniref:AzlC family ABC transporter permease n=1 Tax=Sinanaerobacter chloroacetimidivorans TaxID=2818044 RepID=A0A8J8AZU2_9FIRM|nr:AzlC family ABC transporter permease [Sinanaerobacter chloroacetimidivorans]MBR0596888.1 AzlC family ABC transporter permease [Sinanaerobacter chloroacetimidivorans]
MKQAIKAAFPVTVPVMLGYLSIGIAFGLLFENAGYHFLWAFFMSLIVYAGAMQFIAVSFFYGGIGLIQIAIMTIVVNIRHIFYGLSFLDKFTNMGWKKWYMAFALTDETYSLLCGINIPPSVDGKKFYLCVAMLNQSYWILGSVIGSLAGSFITFNTEGMDFAMTALFIVIFLDQWKAYATHIPALIGVFCTIAALTIFGPGNLAIPAMILILLALMLGRKWIEPKTVERKDEKEDQIP